MHGHLNLVRSIVFLHPGVGMLRPASGGQKVRILTNTRRVVSACIYIITVTGKIPALKSRQKGEHFKQ